MRSAPYAAGGPGPNGGGAGPVLVVEDLSLRRGEAWVLLHLDLAVAAGEVVWLQGANGAGKSTLLHVLAGLLRPRHGRVRAFGQAPGTLAGPARRRLGLMGHPPFCHAALSAEAALAWSLRLAGHGAPAARAAAAGALEEVGLGHAAGVAVGRYSAGMRRRLGLARLFCLSPEVALVDEPFAELDAAGQRLAASCLRRRVLGGVTLVFTSHQEAPAQQLGGRVMRLAGGRLAPG